MPLRKPPTSINTKVPQAGFSSLSSSDDGGLAVVEVGPAVPPLVDLRREFEEATVALELSQGRFNLAYYRYHSALNSAMKTKKHGAPYTSTLDDAGKDEEEKDELEDEEENDELEDEEEKDELEDD